MNAPANECTCTACVGACENKPGWFKPDQIEPLAKALGLTEQELFDRHLMVDYWAADFDLSEDDVFILSPAIVGGTPGEEFDRDPRGKCAWLKDGRCSIHELGKPFECAAYHHTDDEPGHHREAAEAWNAPEHQERIKRLLGREPVAAGDWGILDTLGLGW